MAEEKFYKYVILRDRDGNYLLPYSGTKGLADVAFTGKYRDLIDKPVLDSFLPAAQDEITGYYNIDYTAVYGNAIMTEYTPNHIADGDLAKDIYVPNEEYIYNVVEYLIDLYEDALDDAYDEASQEVPPEEDFPRNFCGSVNARADLNNITSAANYDIYYVINEKKWYMRTTSGTGVGTWVDTYNNKKVTP